jgi:hypothetical protein
MPEKRGRYNVVDKRRGSHPDAPRTSSTSSDYLWREIGRVQDDLDKKADDTEVTHVKELAREAKKIALAAGKTEHFCAQEDDIAMIKKEIRGWKTIKIGLFLSIFVVSMGAVVQFVTFRESTASTAEDVKDIKVSLSKLDDKVDDVQLENAQAKAAQEARQSKTLQDTILKAFKAERERKKRGRRGGN